jgi:hypothetical protein
VALDVMCGTGCYVWYWMLCVVLDGMCGTGCYVWYWMVCVVLDVMSHQIRV